MNNNLKHKVGDKVIVIAQNKIDDHYFAIGTEVEITKLCKAGATNDYWAVSSEGESWGIDECSIETHKIKGYRLKEECKKYKDAALGFWVANGEHLSWSDNHCIAVKYANILIKEGVGHWIEPVYEEETVIIKMSCKDKNGNDDTLNPQLSRKM